jgi:hypothetical protein
VPRPWRKGSCWLGGVLSSLNTYFPVTTEQGVLLGGYIGNALGDVPKENISGAPASTSSEAELLLVTEYVRFPLLGRNRLLEI